MKINEEIIKRMIKEELKNVLDEWKWGQPLDPGDGIQRDEYGNPLTTAGLTRGSSRPPYSNSYVAKLKRELTSKIDASYAEELIMDMYKENPDDFQSHPYPRLRTDAEHDKFQRDMKQVNQRHDDALDRSWWKKMLGMDE